MGSAGRESALGTADPVRKDGIKNFQTRPFASGSFAANTAGCFSPNEAGGDAAAANRSVSGSPQRRGTVCDADGRGPGKAKL